VGVRGWPAWLGLWSLAVVGTMFGKARSEALYLADHQIRRGSDQVVATDHAIAGVPHLVYLLPLWLVGLLCWRRFPWVTRSCLVLGAAGLVFAGGVVGGIPDLGPWYPSAMLVAAAVALWGAWLGTGRVAEPSRVAGLLASAGLVVAGGIGVVLGWRGLDYQHWYFHWFATGPMFAALGVGALLVVLGLVGRWLPDRWWTAAPTVAVLLVAAGVALGFALWWRGYEARLLSRHAESESGWDTMAHLLAGTGLLAGATAMVFRWWSTAAMSVVGGCLLATGQVVRNDDLWRFIS
jgi:hypothetical protein